MPAAEHAARTGIIPTLKRKIAIPAASESASAQGSMLASTGASKPTPIGAHRPHLPEHGVDREPDREVEDDADHRGGDRGERAVERLVAAQHLDEGRAEEDPQEARDEGDPGREQPAERARPASARARRDRDRPP